MKGKRNYNKSIEALNKKVDLDKLDEEELWILYGLLINKLKETKAIRTNNMTAERGEQLAINHYNSTRGLPKLLEAQVGTKNFDAISRDGERFTIKTIKLPNRLTGVFWGMGTPEKPIAEKKFDYLIIVVINKYYLLENMYEISWDDFYKLKKWHKTMKAFNISITNEFCNQSKIIFGNEVSN